MDYSTLDDKTLIALIGQAQPNALDELYNRYNRLVFSLASKMVADHAAAEEIMLDVFIRVWERAGTYRSEQAKVSTWLVSMTRHRAIDCLRRQKVRLDQSSLSWSEVTPDAVPQANNNPERATELTLRQERVRAAIAQLPTDQQEALALAYFKGQSHREVAETLGQPLGTIKTRIRLAMQKLRQLLQDEQNGH
jgi:RNA polymerase sigma-70 factor (ECF subfamily)